MNKNLKCVKKIAIFAIIVSLSMLSLADEKKETTVKIRKIKSVVKIFAVNNRPNYYQPWQNHPQNDFTGSGVVIEGNRILTNGHIVSNSSFIMVRKQGKPKKYIAKKIITGYECDLALLEVEDESFFDDMPPLKFAGLPELQDSISVLGYPMGGDNISITEGVVSRIEPTKYSISERVLLTIQIDAAINPGNSGGPVVNKNGKIVGIAFQGNKSGEGIGYMIPVPVVKHFLEDIKDNKFDGFPDIDIHINTLENPDMRDWLGMKKNQTGSLITHLSLNEKKRGFLKKYDVLLNIEGLDIANDNTVKFREDEVIFWAHFVWRKYIGDTIKFKVLRDKKNIDIDYKLEHSQPLVADRCFDKTPEYFVIGGLVFIPLTQNYLDAWGNWWKAPRDLVQLKLKGEITKERNEVVILSSVLADDTNIGYQKLKYEEVTKINGLKIKNLKHLINTIDDFTEPFLEITFESHKKIVVNIENFKKSTTRILKRYRISSDRSENLRN